MRYHLFFLLLFAVVNLNAQKSFSISVNGDTLNLVDNNGLKQGKWVIHVPELRGEPGYEEEGVYENGQKEGIWRRYNLSGDLLALETYRWNEKDGNQQYFTNMGDLLREESWRATNPDNPYDTIQVPDPEIPDKWETKVIKQDVASVAHGLWRYYEPATGFITKEERFFFGQPEKSNQKSSKLTSRPVKKEKEVDKPKEVLDWEQKNSGKKKVKVIDGRTGF